MSFSGGRDSSLVLAVAAGVARREGLPLPIPVTVRPAGDADTEEHEWQERVVSHLGLDDWERVAIGEELDCVGPEAQKILLRHGVLWPANVHFHLPQLEQAAGGSVLTGIGGDEVFSDSGWERVRLLLAGKVRPTPRDVLRLGLAFAPQAVKRRRFMERNEVELDWLTPAAQAEIGSALGGEAASEPLGWRRRFSWLLGLRYLDIGTRSLGLLARDWDVEMHHPFLDRTFVGALAALPRGRRFAGRTEALAELFASVLPPGLESRSSKAAFSETLWGAPAACSPRAGTARVSTPGSSTSTRYAAAGRSTASLGLTPCCRRCGSSVRTMRGSRAAARASPARRPRSAAAAAPRRATHSDEGAPRGRAAAR